MEFSKCPLVSIILPTFNRADLLPRAVLSVLHQTYTNWELIIVNDGSTDETIRIVESYLDVRIKIITHKVNRGQNAALNSGLKESKGELVAFIDSDDEWLLSFIERHLSFHLNDQLVCTYSFAAKKNNHSLQTVKAFTISGQIYSQALRQGYISHMITLMIPKEALGLVEGFDESFTVCQDDDFCLQLAKHFPFVLIPDPLAIIHETEGSVIANRINYARGWQKLIIKYESEILNECGSLILLWHKLRVGLLFVQAGHLSGWASYEEIHLFTNIAALDKLLIRMYFKLLNFLYQRRYI